MAFETGKFNQNPKIGNRGQASGRLIKENEAIVNVADWLAEIVDPGSGLSINVVGGGGGGSTTAPNEFDLKDLSKNVLFDTGFNVPLDTENTWDMVVNGVLQPPSRNATVTAGGTTVGPADIFLGNLPVSSDSTVGGDFTTRWILQSKKNIKFRNSDQTLNFVSGVFADYSNSVTNDIYIRAFILPNNPNFIAQINWNIDTFGAGVLNPSGIALDFTKIQTVAFHAIKKSMSSFKVGFVIGDKIYYAHEFAISNTLDFLPFMNLDLPIRCEGERNSVDQFQFNYGVFEFNRGVSLTVLADVSVSNPVVNVSLYGCAVYALGESNTSSYPFSAGTKNNLVNITARTPIVSIRPLGLYFGNANKIITYVKTLIFNSQNVDLNKGYILEIIKNGTLVGDSFSDVSTNRSSMSFDLAATSISSGDLLYTDSIYPNARNEINFKDEKSKDFIKGISFTSITFNFGGFSTLTSADTITFVATPIGVDANAGVDVNFDEFV